MNDFFAFCRLYKWRILSVCCGILFAILIFTIGFWRTLLLVLLVLIGVAIGQQADGDPKILRALGKIFRDHDTH